MKLGKRQSTPNSGRQSNRKRDFKIQEKAHVFNLDLKRHQKDGWGDVFGCKENDNSIEKVVGYTQPKVNDLLL